MFENSLIFGKSQLLNLVSLEVKDNAAELFIEENGVVRSEFVPHKYWILSAQPYNGGWTPLKGDLHYKWGKQWDDYEDFNKQRQMLYSKDTYSVWDAREAFLINKGYTYYKGMNPKEVSILSFDIETDGLKHHSGSRVFLISNTYRSVHGTVKKLFCYEDYENDGEMLEDWASWVRERNPSIMCGHNIVSYDLPYMSFVAAIFGKSLHLGRDGSSITFAKKESKFRVDGSRDLHYKKVRCYGREIVDTMFLAYKYDAVERKYESYGLKPIIKQENLEIPGRVFYDTSTIKENIFNPVELEKIKAYAIDDADDALKLFDLMIPAMFYLANSIPKPFQTISESATGSQINSLLVRAYLQSGHSIPKATELSEHVEGGISFAVPGIYKNVLKVDLKSAYPSQVLRFKLYDKQKDPNAYFYQMVKHFAEERFELKKKYKETGDNYYKERDGTAKIFINSAYGVTNTPGLNFNSVEVAKKITLETRTVLSMAIEWASGKPTQYWQDLFEANT
jgi:DNA polymerase I